MIGTFNRDPARSAAAGSLRRLRGTAAIAVVCAMAMAPPGALQAQGQNAPRVQVICEVSGGVARTVRVTYPNTAVRNTHVFMPVAGGPNIIFNFSQRPERVFSFAVPAGQYRLAYSPAGPGGGNSPMLIYHNGVLVIAPFTVRGGICQRSQTPGGTGS